MPSKYCSLSRLIHKLLYVTGQDLQQCTKRELEKTEKINNFEAYLGEKKEKK